MPPQLERQLSGDPTIAVTASSRPVAVCQGAKFAGSKQTQFLRFQALSNGESAREDQRERHPTAFISLAITSGCVTSSSRLFIRVRVEDLSVA